MGLGGDVTVLSVHVEHADIAHDAEPNANYQCWAARRASAHVAADGSVSYERDARDARGHVPDHRPRRRSWKLRAGDEVTVQGHIIGIRDRTQIRIFDQGVEPPMDPTGAFLLHTAPNVRKVGPGRYEKLCIGTTTSARMVRFTEARLAVRRPRDLRQGRLPRRGDRADAAARDGLLRDRRRSGMLETTQIEEIEEVAWEELMPECLWKFRVKDFGPLRSASTPTGPRCTATSREAMHAYDGDAFLDVPLREGKPARAASPTSSTRA